MTGIGYDVHRFVEGRPLVLGGVTIEHTHGLDGHSDADVLSHAIADALLGAMGLPDIGHYFPPGDPACKDICSLKILEKCRELARDNGYRIINVDSTLIAEAPKILPHREAMQGHIANALGLFSLGQIYQEGLGTGQDPVQAHLYYNLAAAAGHPQAAGQRAQVETGLSPDQVLEAQRLAREWQPGTPAPASAD